MGAVKHDGAAKSKPTLATCAITPPHNRPAFEKLAIGPLMILGEDVTGGHYLEVLRLAKQMAVGRNFGPTYAQLHAALVAETGGFLGAFYRGFLPWGLIQCVKGVPVLFVQHETNYQLASNYSNRFSPNVAEKVSGFAGGMAQAFFVCPLQKVKVAAIASHNVNSMRALQVCVNVVTKQGVHSLFDGLFPMTIRRSLDWGIRFGASSEVKNMVFARKQVSGEESPRINFAESVGCGLVGGVCSATTHPLDNIVTNSQKPMPSGTHRDLVSVIKRMAKESGVHAFTRGWEVKIIDNAYHMARMYGVGTVLYDYIHQALQRPLYVQGFQVETPRETQKSWRPSPIH